MSNSSIEYRSAVRSEGLAPAKRPLMRSGDLGEMIEPLQNLVLKYPGAALASAFLVGVVVAWWIKRK